jgi:alpha-tubulin suppressor-like RCC1 family protein
MSFRYAAGIKKPGFNSLAAQTSTTYYDLYGWGQNSSGQLGQSNTTSYSSPKQVGSTTGWTKITASGSSAAGGTFFLSLKTDGSLWGCGGNDQGQLGLGNTTSYSSIKQIGTLTNWSNISAGGGYNTQFSAATKTDGTLWVWGKNNFGQLGLGNTTAYSSPKQLGALTTWSKVATGIYFPYILAIKTDGTLWSWGRNNYGQLGLGNVTSYSSPKQVGALTNWLSITASYSSAYSVKTDGTLWAWGFNGFGELGFNNTTNYSSPKQIGALSNWLYIASAYNHVLAVKTDGSLWSWGRNLFGPLGLGNQTSYSSPKQVGALTNWSKPMGGGPLISFAIKTNGTLWSWGYNTAGALGNGNITSTSSPAQVGSLTTWLSVAAGYYSAFGLV